MTLPRPRLQPSLAPRPSLGLRVAGLRRVFGTTVALWDVDLTARSHDLVAISGPNGSGKSTLLRLLAGLVAPSAGRIVWTREAHGREVDGEPRIAYVGHADHLFEELSPLENVTLSARLARRDPAAAAAWLGRLGLAAVASRRVAGLSAGTRRRVALARALAAGPDALLLDEPTTSLDVASADTAVAVLEDARREGLMVIVAAHDALLRVLPATRHVELAGGYPAPQPGPSPVGRLAAGETTP